MRIPTRLYFTASRYLIIRRPMSSAGKLTYPDGSYIFYKKREATKLDLPGLVFCSGYASNLDGNKARYLDTFCEKKGLACVRFDYMGHEFSSGTMDDITLSLWKENTLDIIDKLTEGPQILVGSSMGGWLSLLTAVERPLRIFALVGIANATDMMYRRYANLSDSVKEEIERVGHLSLDMYGYTDGGKIPHACFKDLNKHVLLESNEKIPVTCPMRLLHGMNDDVVPYETSLEIARKLESDDVEVYLDKKADHRFSSDKNLKLLGTVLDELVELWSQTRKP